MVRSTLRFGYKAAAVASGIAALIFIIGFVTVLV